MPKTYKINKILLSSFSWLSILIELSKGKEMTGYALLKHIYNFGFPVSSATVYYQLKMMEEDGLVQAKPVRRGQGYKSVYMMTEKGKEAFEEFKVKWQKSLEYAYADLHIKK